MSAKLLFFVLSKSQNYHKYAVYVYNISAHHIYLKSMYLRVLRTLNGFILRNSECGLELVDMYDSLRMVNYRAYRYSISLE